MKYGETMKQSKQIEDAFKQYKDGLITREELDAQIITACEEAKKINSRKKLDVDSFIKKLMEDLG